MPRKLTTYQTSLGFFELAVAAPSMKAALEAWGSKSNVFHQGFAKEVRNPAIIAAAMAKPGVVLRRAVGSNDTFKENAELPHDFSVATIKQAATKAKPTAKEPPAHKPDAKATAAAARAYEQEEKRRKQEREKELAAREKQREQRERAIAKAEAAFEEAKRIHVTKTQEIEDARTALDRQQQAEDARWEKEREKLEARLARAQE